MDFLHKIGFTVLLYLLATKVSIASCRFKTANDLLASMKSRHPQLIENRATIEVSNRWIEVAEQRPNPKVQAQGVTGQEIEGDVDRLSVSLMHTFELGGKRDSRIGYATSRRKQLKASLRDSDENILVAAILKAYRLRQVIELIPVYEEAFETFSKILKIKLKRKSLSPEEQVEQETLALATSDYRLKVSKLLSEKINLGRHLSLFVGEKCEIRREVLPEKIELSLQFDETKEIDRYSRLQNAKMNLESAKMKLEVERSNAFPNLSLGPAFENENIAGRDYQTFGISLNMELPILNSNSGSKRQALADINRAKKLYENTRREASLDLEAWIEKYNALSNSLKAIGTRKDLEKKHLKIEKLFKRGMISTALIIETHRQLIEFANTRYEFELGVVEALWNIYKINGTLMNEKF